MRLVVFVILGYLSGCSLYQDTLHEAYVECTGRKGIAYVTIKDDTTCTVQCVDGYRVDVECNAGDN